jgi:hypothetical protein
MRWAEHIACMRWNINAEKALVSKLEGKSYLQDLGVDGRFHSSFCMHFSSDPFYKPSPSQPHGFCYPHNAMIHPIWSTEYIVAQARWRESICANCQGPRMTEILQEDSRMTSLTQMCQQQAAKLSGPVQLRWEAAYSVRVWRNTACFKMQVTACNSTE